MELADLSSSFGTELALGGAGAGASDDHVAASTSQLVLPTQAGGDKDEGGSLVQAAVSVLEQQTGVDGADVQGRATAVAAAHVGAATSAHMLKVAAGEETLTDAALATAPVDPRAKTGMLSALSWRRICGGMASRAQAFYLVVLTFLVCTLTDSALRLLIIMQMDASGFTAMNVAIVVAFNELVALSTGILIAFLQYKTNAKSALLIGMAFQLLGAIMLMPFRWPDSWAALGAVGGQVAYITTAQCLSGAGREIISRCGKAGQTLKADDATDTIGRGEQIVSMLAGLVPELHALGGFLGLLLLQFAGFLPTLLLIGCSHVVLLVPILIFLPSGKFASADPAAKVKLGRLARLSTAALVVCTSLASLLASRDLWFAVSLPFFLSNVAGWPLIGIGAFTATWSLLVSMVQTFAAPLLLRALRCLPPKASHGWPWALCLFLVSLCVAVMFTVSVAGSTNDGGGSTTIINAVLVPGVFLWAACFAVMQTIHQSLAITLCAELPPPVVQSGLLAAASAGRIVGVLVGSALFTFYYTFNVPVDGLSFNVTLTSFSACLWAGTVASLLVFLLSFVLRALLANPATSARPTPAAAADASQEEAGGTRSRGVPAEDDDAVAPAAASTAQAGPTTTTTTTATAAAAAAIADALPLHL